MSQVVPLWVHKWMQDNRWAYGMLRAMAPAAVDARRQHHAEAADPRSTAGSFGLQVAVDFEGPFMFGTSVDSATLALPASIGKLLRAVEPLPAEVVAVAFNTAALYR